MTRTEVIALPTVGLVQVRVAPRDVTVRAHCRSFLLSDDEADALLRELAAARGMTIAPAPPKPRHRSGQVAAPHRQPYTGRSGLTDTQRARALASIGGAA